MMTVGFDFGTTNSLVSQVVGNAAISYFDNRGLPIPSVVCYEGGDVIVGRQAKDRVEDAGLGVYGNIVRSPKILMLYDSIYVDGVERSIIDVVADVIRGVKNQTLERRAGGMESLDAAVATIPITFDGGRRAKLREAFGRAGIRIVQYVHEPLAALYGYFREAGGIRANLRRYDRQYVLVFDWGGGTLDLTLCRLDNGMILQIANDGSDEVGGDWFDDALRNEVIRVARDAQGLPESVSIHADAKSRLLHRCERAKIDLSDRDSVQIYVEHFFRDVEKEELDLKVTRDFLEGVTRPLIDSGTERIDRLLDTARLSPPQIGLCLATGGMVNMPAIRSRLHERFGPQRVRVPESGTGAISIGAAWFAHDNAGLRLAKTVEVALARQTYVPVLKADTKMPMQGEVCGEYFDLYVVDPRDGFAKIELISPRRPGRVIPTNDVRKVLATMTVNIDSNARPFFERLRMRVEVDDNLILHATTVSLMTGHRDQVEVHDLEFCVSVGMDDLLAASKADSKDQRREDSEPLPKGMVTLRPNVSDKVDPTLVPGELWYEHRPQDFDVRLNPPRIQVEERLYYEPCKLCGRPSYDPRCKCVYGTMK